MKKIIILASFMAGYRVDVFKGIADKYEVTVLFGASSNESRNKEWFVKDERLKYYIVDTEDGKKVAAQYYKNLNQFDLVLGYDWYQIWALKFEFKAWLLGIPYIVNCDGAFIKSFHVKDLVKIFFIRNAAACFAGGQFAKKYFIHYGAKAEKIYIHHFTSLHEKDIINYTLTAHQKKELRYLLGISEKKMVLAVGQFIERKGFEILLDAWSELKCPDAQLIFIGGGDLKEKYEQQIIERNIPNVIIMDFVPFDQIFKYYQAADVFALATREDIWGLVVNEAMANFVPVIISDKCVAGLELIQNGKNGVIIPNNDKDKWVDAIRGCLSNETMCFDMADFGRRAICNYTIEGTIKKNLEVIESILDCR